MSSQISGHLWAPSGAYDALATVTLSASASSVTFTGIPSEYKHLQIRGIHRTTGAYNVGDVYMRVNGDSGSNYANHILVGDGTSAAAGGGGNRTSVMGYDYYNSIGATGLANAFATCIIDILDYANTSKYKTMRFLEGREFNSNNTDGRVYFESGLWMNTGAITSITFSALNGAGAAASLDTNTTFALFGVR
jgi:hypothetical protein